jgi:hypothetical protein
MATTIRYGSTNDQVATFDHPRELRTKGWPIPPLQPIASWTTSLTAFETYCNADQFDYAIQFLAKEHVFAVLTDVPEAKRTAFKAYIQNNFRSLPTQLGGAVTDWRTDGRAVERSPL